MRSKRSSSRLNLSSHAKVRSTRIRNAWIASLKKRFRPRFVRLRLRGFSGMLGIKPALKMLKFEHKLRMSHEPVFLEHVSTTCDLQGRFFEFHPEQKG